MARKTYIVCVILLLLRTCDFKYNSRIEKFKKFAIGKAGSTRNYIQELTIYDVECMVYADKREWKHKDIPECESMKLALRTSEKDYGAFTLTAKEFWLQNPICTLRDARDCYALNPNDYDVGLDDPLRICNGTVEGFFKMERENYTGYEVYQHENGKYYLYKHVDLHRPAAQYFYTPCGVHMRKVMKRTRNRTTNYYPNVGCNCYDSLLNLKQIGLIVVVDKKVADRCFAKDSKIEHNIDAIFERVNKLFLPLKINITITWEIHWDEEDQIEFNRFANVTLRNFAKYYRDVVRKRYPKCSDMALLLMNRDVDWTGNANEGSICSKNNRLDSMPVAFVQTGEDKIGKEVVHQITHQIGHVLGFVDLERSNASGCFSKNKRCLMRSFRNRDEEWSWFTKYLFHDNSVDGKYGCLEKRIPRLCRT